MQDEREFRHGTVHAGYVMGHRLGMDLEVGHAPGLPIKVVVPGFLEAIQIIDVAEVVVVVHLLMAAGKDTPIPVEEDGPVYP